MKIPKDFNDLAIRRSEIILKTGIGFDRSIRDMLAHAYTCGFIDCYDINASQCNHENAKQQQLHQSESGNAEGKA